MSLVEGGEYSIFQNQDLMLDFSSIVPDSPNRFGSNNNINNKKNGFQIQSKPLNTINGNNNNNNNLNSPSMNSSNNTSPEQIPQPLQPQISPPPPPPQQQQHQQQQHNVQFNPSIQQQQQHHQFNSNTMTMEDQLFSIFLSQNDKDNLPNMNMENSNVNNNVLNNNGNNNNINNNGFINTSMIKLEDQHIQHHRQDHFNGVMVPDSSLHNIHQHQQLQQQIPPPQPQQKKLEFLNEPMKQYNVVPESIFEMSYNPMPLQSSINGLSNENLINQQILVHHQHQLQHQQAQQIQQNNTQKNKVLKKKDDDQCKIKKRKFISATPVKGENGTTLMPTTDGNQNIEEERTIKRQRRLVKNREAAQLFRQRQKAYIQDLEKKVNDLSSTNSEFRARVELLNSENKLIREQLLYLRNFITQAVSFSFPPKVGGNGTPGSNSVGIGSPIPVTQGICPPDMLNLQNPMIMSAIAEAASKNSSFRAGFIGALPSPPLPQQSQQQQQSPSSSLNLVNNNNNNNQSPTKNQQMVPFLNNNTPPQQMSISPQSATPLQQFNQQK